MKLTAEQIADNWNILLSRIDAYISEPRRSKLKEFYLKHEDRLMLMPAAHKKEYHNAFPGGYVDHVIRVIDASLKINNIWNEFGVNTSTYTIEELVFSALNHDLGKMGDEEHESYIPQTDNWRKEKLGEDYMFNDKLAFASVPDRGLFLLQSNGIPYTFNEMLAIQTHDGLYDEGNKKYLVSFSSETKPRTSLPYILHQGDLLAARIEWENEYLKDNKFEKPQIKNPISKPPTKTPTKTKALGTIKDSNLKNIFDTL
jgi:hypothetical protein